MDDASFEDIIFMKHCDLAFIALHQHMWIRRWTHYGRSVPWSHGVHVEFPDWANQPSWVCCSISAHGSRPAADQGGWLLAANLQSSVWWLTFIEISLNEYTSLTSTPSSVTAQCLEHDGHSAPQQALLV